MTTFTSSVSPQGHSHRNESQHHVQSKGKGGTPADSAAKSPVNSNNWRDVHSNILAMDQFYDASFYSWIKNENNVHVSSSHIKRIIVEYDVDKVSNGLRWLISDWTLGAITVLVRRVFTDALWDHPTLQPQPPPHNSPANITPSKRKCSVFDPALPDSDGHSPSESMAGGVAYDSQALAQILKQISIIRQLIEGWSSNFVGELLVTVMADWSATQKQLFVQNISMGWSFQKLSEVFIHLGSTLEWQVKLEMLKKFSQTKEAWQANPRRVHHRRKRSSLANLNNRSAELLQTALFIAHDDLGQ